MQLLFGENVNINGRMAGSGIDAHFWGFDNSVKDTMMGLTLLIESQEV